MEQLRKAGTPDNRFDLKENFYYNNIFSKSERPLTYI